MNNDNNANSIFNVSNQNKWIEVRSYYVHYYYNFDMIFHSHARIEIMYVVSGEAVFEYKTPEGTYDKILILQNSYVLVDADVHHKISVISTPTQILNLEFILAPADKSGFFLKNLYKDKQAHDFFSTGHNVCCIADNGMLYQNISMLQNYIKKDFGKPIDELLNHLLVSFLLLISKQFYENKSHMLVVSQVKKAVGYISQYYNSNITLALMAKISEVSPNYLNTLFKNNFGITVMNFLNKYRINRAAMLLTSSKMPVEEVQKQVGYNNKASFNQNFIKFLGVSPRKFRQEKHEQNIVAQHLSDIGNDYWS